MRSKMCEEEVIAWLSSNRPDIKLTGSYKTLSAKTEFEFISCGHRQTMRFCDIQRGRTCDACKKYQKSLAQNRTDLLQYWHPNKNLPLIPTSVSAYSHVDAWWICEEGHEYKQKIANKVAKNYGCTVCSGQLIVPGVNDLAALFPELANEWHPTKNVGIIPSLVSAGSQKKYWWLRKCAINSSI